MSSQIAWPPASEAAPGGKKTDLSISAGTSATLASMSVLNDRAIAALEALPEEMRERAVDYLEEQARNLAIIREMIAEAEADIETGRVAPLDMDEIVATARRMASAQSEG